jgi:cell division protein FtsB
MGVSRSRRWGGWYVGALALLAALSAFDPGGLRKHLRLQEDVQRMADENRRLTDENARLAREARALRSEPAALERAAREELRFVRPGEIVFRLDGDAGGGTP